MQEREREKERRALLRFSLRTIPFFHFFRLLFLHGFFIISRSNSLEKWRKQSENTTGTTEIENEKSEHYNTQALLKRTFHGLPRPQDCH